MKTIKRRHAVLIPVLITCACSRTDPSLQIAVDQALSARGDTNALSIDISVSRRIVQLSGEVTSRDQERQAVAAAQSVPGVREVIDGLRLSDATIVTAVKQALAADPLVGRIPIEVDASNGHVRLISDQTGPDDRKQAVAIASKIDGVRQVEDRMR